MELCRGVYLAGPMAGLTAQDMKSWRWYAHDKLGDSDIKVLDPTRRISYHEQILNDRGLDRNIANRIFKQDLRDIARCEVVLVDMRDLPGIKGQGTAAEVMFAHMKNKVIVLWKTPNDSLNPFMTAMATEVHVALEEAVEACIEYAG